MVTYEDILVPTDGSSGSGRTIDHAVSIARDNDATLHGLFVVDKRRYRAADEETTDDVRASLEEEGDRALDDLTVRGEEGGARVMTDRREGIPHRTIIDYAEDEGIDLIVMGTHGRTGRNRAATLGSVTERVVKGAEVPVLVVQID
ncbi:MAG: universal stress protein [Haloarculaceae archaeon]